MSQNEELEQLTLEANRKQIEQQARGADTKSRLRELRRAIANARVARQLAGQPDPHR